MRRSLCSPAPRLRVAAGVVLLPLLLAACSDSGSTASPATSSTTAAAPAATGAAGATTAAAAGGACPGKAGTDLVVLADDKQLQNSDNVVPVVTTKVAKPPLTDALNAVSKALTQDRLQELNKDVSVDKKTPEEAATSLVSGISDLPATGGSGPITVAAADFSENVALANVYAAALTKAGYKATVKKIGSRELYEPALEKGEVQVIPEYAATLTSFLAKKAKSTVAPSGDIAKTIATLTPLAAAAGLTVLTPASATDQNAFAVTKATADAYGLKTLSDLATKCTSGVTLGGPPECPTRDFCGLGLTKVYNLQFTFTALDPDGPLTRSALKQGRATVAEVFSSDADVVASS